MDYTDEDAKTYWSTLTTLRYEIRKNEKRIREWEQQAITDHAEEPALRDLIADAKKRIAQLSERFSEIEETEEACLNGELDEHG
jgi:predicted  nucleic acid-binding Zn-ribbon protein